MRYLAKSLCVCVYCVCGWNEEKETENKMRSVASMKYRGAPAIKRARKMCAHTNTQQSVYIEYKDKRYSLSELRPYKLFSYCTTVIICENRVLVVLL